MNKEKNVLFEAKNKNEGKKRKKEKEKMKKTYAEGFKSGYLLANNKKLKGNLLTYEARI